MARVSDFYFQNNLSLNFFYGGGEGKGRLASVREFVL